MTVGAVVALSASLLTATYALVVLVTVVLGDDPLPLGFRVSVAVTALVVVLTWSAGASVLAWLTLGGSHAARLGLLVCALLAGSLSLTVSVLLTGAVLTMAASVVTIVLLLTASARAWFRMQRGASPAG